MTNTSHPLRGLSHNPSPIADCPNCDGTGRDDAFQSPCDCAHWVARRGTASTLGRGMTMATGETMQRGYSRNGGGASGRPAPTATPAQVRYLHTLIGERFAPTFTVAEGDRDALARIEAASDHPMSRAAASEFIDMLLAMKSVRPARTTAPTAAPARTNRYDARCARCNGNVPAGQGELRGDRTTRYTVVHTECPTQPEPVAPAGTVVADGHYAIASTGDNDLAFYKVEAGEGRWAGRTFVRLVVGGHPDRNVPAAQVAGIRARIADDPEAAARYGQQIGRCYRCNRHLTDEVSRRLGIGPDCRTR